MFHPAYKHSERFNAIKILSFKFLLVLAGCHPLQETRQNVEQNAQRQLETI